MGCCIRAIQPRRSAPSPNNRVVTFPTSEILVYSVYLQAVVAGKSQKRCPAARLNDCIVSSLVITLLRVNSNRSPSDSYYSHIGTRQINVNPSCQEKSIVQINSLRVIKSDQLHGRINMPSPRLHLEFCYQNYLFLIG